MHSTKWTGNKFFPCDIGLRQGENLSPLLFSLFLNDLEMYLINNQCDGITIDYADDDIFVFLKLLILLYADDTVILAEDEAKLQNSLNYFLYYCNEWKLNINYKKTKIIVFGARNTHKYNFYLDENPAGISTLNQR